MAALGSALLLAVFAAVLRQQSLIASSHVGSALIEPPAQRSGTRWPARERYSAPLPAAGRTSSWELVTNLFDGLKGAGLRPDVWTFTSLIQASQACRRPWKQALHLFEQMQTAGQRRALLWAVRQ